MTIQELKIGNWVYDSKTTMFPMQVVAIGTDWIHLDFFGNEGDVWEKYLQDVEPIPITKEILLKCGFEQINYKFFKKPYMSIYKTCDGWFVHIDDVQFQTAVAIPVKHIHQLQNAYYLATNKELEIKF